MTRVDDLKLALLPWMTPDLESFLEAVGAMMAEVTTYADDTDTNVGWTILFDPDRAPAKALPFLAQWYGERLPVGLTEAQQREWIKDNPNSRRGTMESIFLAAQRNLIGSRTVSWSERTDPASGPNPEDHLVIHTYALETPFPDRVLADILSVAPADIEVHYSFVTGQTYGDVNAAYANYAALTAAYATYADMARDIAGVTSYSRPRP